MGLAKNKAGNEQLTEVTKVQTSVVSLLCARAALDVLERDNAEEATKFEEARLKPRGLSFNALPLVLQERLQVLAIRE